MSVTVCSQRFFSENNSPSNAVAVNEDSASVLPIAAAINERDKDIRKKE
ncbi:hypothetical protein KUC_3663 [Vreelandella boliviensis LC1]|uniref:Uncharacterized protein n=1 Tax=Vreelandella boliviensis LC1 TaxID=1072583 RepID=A0A7U9BXV6_9GAMM|nr:hypothetical protein KUC_3663 [Halomonas boliviensis LC1]